MARLRVWRALDAWRRAGGLTGFGINVRFGDKGAQKATAVVGARYGVDAWTRYGPALGPHASAGRLVFEGPRVRLTRQGMLVANDVMTVFV